MVNRRTHCRMYDTARRRRKAGKRLDLIAFGSQPHSGFFWVNNNKDSGDTGGDGTPGHRIDGDITSDTLIGSIHGRRDLVDFFPVYLNLGGLLQVASNVTILLKQADSALFFIETSLTPTNYMNYLRDTNFFSSLPYGFTATLPIGPGGRGLSQDFYNNIRTNNGGIILVEACKPTTAPLVMEIWQGTNLLAQTSAYLSIDDVETMYRHKNLMLYQTANSLRGPADRLTAPNEPDTQEKNFVFVHGYNVNPYQATGWIADMFKRMYWSGSQAKFYGVTWDGAASQFMGAFTPNYHTNVYNAFLTASNLANFLGTLTNGPTVLAAHSLGNMVCLSAISDWNAPVSKYFMIDAAVATEAIDASVSSTVPMVHPAWYDYNRRLWASSWYGLFSAGDGRNGLAWSNRLANLPFTNVYNFYSSGEEVLRQHDGTPPTVTSAIFDQGVMNGLLGVEPAGVYAWAWQEKMKGTCPGNWILGSSHGGWKFNTNYSGLTPAQANALPDSQLQTNAFFQFVAANFTADSALYGGSASTYAQANRNRLLSDAIQALTLPIGANPVPKLSPQNGPSRNYDMNVVHRNGWPASRSTTEKLNWHHSDVRVLAYTFTYKLFDDFVELGDLQ